MTNWSTIPYSSRLPKPIVTAHGAYHERNGLLLVVNAGGDDCGLGDLAPLPGFSKESLDEARRRWEVVRGKAAQWGAPETPEELGALSSELDEATAGVPSLRYALELALADLG
ncbi:MAG: hypothetical protein HZB43_08240, partial [candidate division Zixibacteria bacterium]|nr:hypothetical protein [candidate division Zixibacteria bacterium]